MLDPRPLLVGTLYQAVVIALWAFISGKIFRALYPAKNVIMIYGLEQPARMLVEKMSKRYDKYNITRMMNVSEGLEAITAEIPNYDGVVKMCIRDSGMIKGGHKTKIGYIPSGTTNDFAYGIGLSSDIMTAADDIVSGTPKAFDAGRFNRCV